MTRPRVLLVSNSDASFVRGDEAILRELGDVRFLLYRGRRDFPRLLAAIVQSDITVAWFVLGYATTSVLVSRMLGKPTILIAGGWDVVALPDIGYGAMLTADRILKTRVALLGATKVLAVSESTRAETLQWSSRNVEVLYNAVDVDFFRPGSCNEAQAMTVAVVQNETTFRKKGLHIFIEAARRVAEIPFLLVGRISPEVEARIRAVAPANLRVVGSVSRDDLLHLYQTSRVYVQLSAHESFGVSLAEAMSCACVPVVSDRAALPEIVGSVGIVVPYGDVDAAALAIRQALDSPERGRQARQRAVAAFTVDARRRGLHGAIRSCL